MAKTNQIKVALKPDLTDVINVARILADHMRELANELEAYKETM